MNQQPDTSPIPKAKREIRSKYPRLDSGFPVASLDPEPIQARDGDIDTIWRECVPFFKMYLNDIVITFDKTHLRFHHATPATAINMVRDGILKRLAFDGVKTGNIGMHLSQNTQIMELMTPGYSSASHALQAEIFSLIEVKRPPGFAAPPQKPA